MSKSIGKSIKIQAEKHTLAVTRYLAPWQMQCPGSEMGPPTKDTEPKPEQEMQPTLRTISKTLATKERDQSFSVYLFKEFIISKKYYNTDQTVSSEQIDNEFSEVNPSQQVTGHVYHATSD